MMVFPIEYGSQPSGPLGTFTGWLLWGHLGVTVFIVLAGFSLTIAVAPREGVLKGGFKGFMARRAWRIIPPYLLAIALTAALSLTYIGEKTGTHWDLSLPLSWQSVLANVLLIQDIWRVPGVSYVFWSVAVEWHIYLMFPVMLWIWRRWNLYAALAFGSLVGLAGVGLARYVDGINGLWPVYYTLFALGVGACAIGHYAPAWGRRIPFGSIGLLGLLAVALILSIKQWEWFVAHAKFVDLLAGVSISLLLLSLHLGRMNPLKRMLSARWLVFVGGFSYSIYLMHAPILQVFWQLFAISSLSNPAVRVVVMVALIAPLTAAATYGFYWFCERPFIGTWRRVKLGADKSQDRVQLDT
jgi:peptidoglycan/LPS O-acetylase OafA/YrhL